jgi:5-methylcytosine-specific restriction endonuclease McrA
MAGSIKRLQRAAQPDWAAPTPAEPVCPLCGRPIPPPQQDAHHLVPKSKGGRETLFLHRICHRQVHAVLSETELARSYNTAEALPYFKTNS